MEESSRKFSYLNTYNIEKMASKRSLFRWLTMDHQAHQETKEGKWHRLLRVLSLEPTPRWLHLINPPPILFQSVLNRREAEMLSLLWDACNSRSHCKGHLSQAGPDWNGSELPQETSERGQMPPKHSLLLFLFLWSGLWVPCQHSPCFLDSSTFPTH